MEIIAALDLPRRKGSNAPDFGVAHRSNAVDVVHVLMGCQVRERTPSQDKLQFVQCVLLAAVTAQESRFVPVENESCGVVPGYVGDPARPKRQSKSAPALGQKWPALESERGYGRNSQCTKHPLPPRSCRSA